MVQLAHAIPATIGGIGFEFSVVRNAKDGSEEELAAYGRMRDNVSELVGIALGSIFDIASAPIMQEASRNIIGIRGMPASVRALLARGVVDGIIGGGQQGVVDVISDTVMDALAGDDWR